MPSTFSSILDIWLVTTAGAPFTGAASFSLRQQGGSFYAAAPSQLTSLGLGYWRIALSDGDRAVPGWLLVVGSGPGAADAYAAVWCGPDAGPIAGLASPYYSLPFYLASPSTGVGVAGLSPAVEILTPGTSAFATPAGPVREVGLGVYEVLPTTADVAAAGPLPIQAAAAGAALFGDAFTLLASATGQDVVAAALAWWNATPAAAALTASGQLWLVEAPEGVAVSLPYATFSLVAEVPETYTTDLSRPWTRTHLQFNFHAATDLAAATAAEAFRSLFLGAALSVNGSAVAHVLPDGHGLQVGSGLGPGGRDCWAAYEVFDIAWTP